MLAVDQCVPARGSSYVIAKSHVRVKLVSFAISPGYDIRFDSIGATMRLSAYRFTIHHDSLCGRTSICNIMHNARSRNNCRRVQSVFRQSRLTASDYRFPVARTDPPMAYVSFRTRYQLRIVNRSNRNRPRPFPTAFLKEHKKDVDYTNWIDTCSADRCTETVFKKKEQNGEKRKEGDIMLEIFFLNISVYIYSHKIVTMLIKYFIARVYWCDNIRNKFY